MNWYLLWRQLVIVVTVLSLLAKDSLLDSVMRLILTDFVHYFASLRKLYTQWQRWLPNCLISSCVAKGVSIMGTYIFIYCVLGYIYLC